MYCWYAAIHDVAMFSKKEEVCKLVGGNARCCDKNVADVTDRSRLYNFTVADFAQTALWIRIPLLNVLNEQSYSYYILRLELIPTVTNS